MARVRGVKGLCMLAAAASIFACAAPPGPARAAGSRPEGRPSVKTPAKHPAISTGEVDNGFIDVRAFGATGDGSTDDTAPIQAAIDSAEEGSVVFFAAPPSYYKVSRALRVDETVKLTGEGSEIRQTKKDAVLLRITASGVSVSGLRLVGPQYAESVYESQAISAAGASAGSPVRGVSITGNEIESWGFFGIALKNVTDFEVRDNTIRNIYYAGIIGYSVIRGEITGNTVDNVVGRGNAYGIALTRQEVDSLSDAPRSSDILVSRNSINNVPDWEGLDTHGGQRIIFKGNVVTATRHGIVVGKGDGAGDVARFAPLDVEIADNVLDNGAGQSTGFGIAVTGAMGQGPGSPVEKATVVIRGNYVRGYGKEYNFSSGAVYLKGTQGMALRGNTIVNAGANAVVLYSYNHDFSITGNKIIDPWSGSLPHATGVLLSNGYNSGYIGGNDFRRGGKVASSVLTNAVWVVSDPTHFVTMGANHSEASEYVHDPGGRAVYTVWQSSTNAHK